VLPVTPRPRKAIGRMRFNRRRCNMRLLLRQSVQVVAPRIELGTTRLSAVSGQPALDYHRSRAPRSRTNMENLLLPKQACCHLHLCPCVDQIVSQNGRIRTSGTDRHGRRLVAPGPRPGAISRLRHVLLAVGWEVLATNPAVHGRSVPASPALQTGAKPSQLPAHQRKKPGVV
jgi:hypothetical protein